MKLLVKQRVSELTADINFFLVFFFYVVFQVFIQVGYVEPHVVHSFSFILALTIPVSILGLLVDRRVYALIKMPVVKAYVFFLVFYFFFVLYNFAIGVGLDHLIYHVKSVFRLVAFYLLTLNVYVGGAFDRRRNILTFLGVSFLIVILSVAEVLNIGSIYYEGGYFELDYQMLAFLILFFWLGSAPAKNYLYELFLAFLLLGALYFLGARTEFYMAFVLLVIRLFVIAKNRLLIVFFFIISLSVLLHVAFFYVGVEALSNIRIFALLFEGADASRSSRGDLTREAFNTISNYPFLGDFGGHDLGAYAHNLLSAWVDFGFFGFLYLVLLVFFPFIHALVNLNKARYSLYFSVISCLSLLIVAFVLAKTYSYSMLSVALAYYGLWQLKQDGIEYGRG